MTIRPHLVVVHYPPRDLNCQAGLSDPARTGQGKQAAGRIMEESGDAAELSCPADKRRGMSRKIVCDHERAFSQIAIWVIEL
jgi:hypothetical protein